ncbi:MAG: hypothetical protein ACTS73_04800 [Arsenophonus sp. NEOnobi-MAG3]
MKKKCLEEHSQGYLQDLIDTCYIYFLPDGMYSSVRQDDSLCLLLIIGVSEH